MDRLPLRLLAFALGPLVARRAASAGRKTVTGQTPRQLRSPGDAAHAAPSEADVATAGNLVGSSPWLLASAAAVAVALAAAVASQERAAPPKPAAMHDEEDFGGV